MTKSSLKASVYLLLASLFAFSAQSFFFLPHRLGVLIGGRSFTFIALLVILFLVTSYLNLSLIFYPFSAKKEKITSLLSLLSLGFLVFLYIEASLYVEPILLVSLAIASVLFAWRKDQEKDYFEYLIIAASIIIGLGIFFFPHFFEHPLYQPAASFKSLFAILLLTAAVLRLLFILFQFSPVQRTLPKLISLPWIGWTLTFLWALEISIVFPAAIILFALLTSGLLPFEKFRLPERTSLGASVFPVFFLFYSSLLFVFLYLIYGGDASFSVHKSEISFVFFLILGVVLLYGVMSLYFILYQLINMPSLQQDNEQKTTALEKFTKRLFAPKQEEDTLSEWQAVKIQRLSEQLIEEKDRGNRFTVLQKIREKLDDYFDAPVAAQLMINILLKHFKADVIAISLFDIETRELSILASGGRMSAGIPKGYRQSIDVGVMGRAARKRKTQVVADTTKDQDYFSVQEDKILSEVAIPLIQHGRLKGAMLIASKEKGFFSVAEVLIFEAAAEELLKTWARSGYNRRLTALIKSNITLSKTPNLQASIEEISGIARETLEARFVFTALFDRDGSFTRTSSVGYAPNLLACLSEDLNTNELLKVALAVDDPFRIIDVRKYEKAPSIVLDHNMLRGVIIVPLLLQGYNIGAILGFGKQGGVSFSEKDESLAKLLSTQASAVLESAWLIKELRTTTATTTALFTLSSGILQLDKIEEAAELIAKEVLRLAKASVVGIVLFSLDREIQTSLEVTKDGVEFGKPIPVEFVEQSLTTGESITLSSGEETAYIYLPIQTALRKYGVLWVKSSDGEHQASSQAQMLQTLTNQAAMALERVMLLIDTRKKAVELKEAFGKLQITYDQTLEALMSALDARDRETEGHSNRVSEAACSLGKELNLSEAQYRSLQRGSLLHDIGKIGISDTILNKPGELTDEEWQLMRQHPSIGKNIIQEIPFLEEALPVVYSHHERWDGSGYPQGLRGEEIPIEARIFAVADIFDALTSHRPYRKKISDEEALDYLKEKSGILVDPKVVLAFEKLIKTGKIKSVPPIKS